MPIPHNPEGSHPPEEMPAAYRPLAQEFDRDHFHFRQLKRRGDVALFEKKKPSHSKAFYEVVIVIKRPECSFKGQTFPAHEAMPMSEDWGEMGWSFSDREPAERCFAEKEAIEMASGSCIP